MSSSAVSAPLHQHRPLVLADLVPGALVRDAALVVGGAAFVGLLAQIAIPVAGSPVPVTGQTLGVLTVGAALGWQRGLAALALYMVAGLAGVPWFAGGAAGYTSASFGYIVGFVLAAGIVGLVASRGGDRNPVPTVGTMVLGNAVIYAVGVPWLMWSLHVGLQGGWDIGMRSYLIGDVVKIAIAAGLLPFAWRLMDRLQRR